MCDSCNKPNVKRTAIFWISIGLLLFGAFCLRLSQALEASRTKYYLEQNSVSNLVDSTFHLGYWKGVRETADAILNHPSNSNVKVTIELKDLIKKDKMN